jgi:hypothetical protein
MTDDAGVYSDFDHDVTIESIDEKEIHFVARVVLCEKREKMDVPMSFLDERWKRLARFVEGNHLVWATWILWKTRDSLHVPVSAKNMDAFVLPTFDKVLDVPDWALDKHTAAGKRLCRDYDFFFRGRSQNRQQNIR